VNRSLRVGISISLLISASLILHLGSPIASVPIRRPLAGFPATLAGWKGSEESILEPDVRDVLKLSDYVMRRYQDLAENDLWLFVGYWGRQRRGAQPHSPKNCLPGHGWEPLEALQMTIPLPKPFAPITVNRYVVQKSVERQVVFYWYQTRGEVIATEFAARLETAKNSILRRRTDGALVRVSTLVSGSVPETSARLVEYIQAMYPTLGDFLPD
jgi:EpsI family protein